MIGRILCLLLLVAGLRAQEVLVRGDAPGEALQGQRGAVVRVGRILHVEDGRGGSRRFALPAAAAAWDLERSSELPAALLARGVLLTGEALSWFEIGREPARDRVVVLARLDGLFRGRPDDGPTRLALFAPRAHAGECAVAVPGLDALAVFVLDATEGTVRRRFELPLAAYSEQTLGYGLGYRMRTELRVPAHHVITAAGGRYRVLARERDRWTLFEEDGAARPYGPTADEETHEILDFAVRVPPRVGDFDGDGLVDLLVFDPGGGFVLNYLGRSRTAPADGVTPAGAERGAEPDQVIRSGGWILHAWSADMDGDGREDLVLLQIPKLNVIEQVKVIREAAIPVNLEIRRRGEDGLLAATPTGVQSGSLAVALSLTRNERRIEPRLALLPLPRAGAGGGLVFPHEDAAWRHELDAEGRWQPTERIAPLAADETVPFVSEAAWRRGEEGEELLLIHRGDGGGGRVARHRLSRR